MRWKGTKNGINDFTFFLLSDTFPHNLFAPTFIFMAVLFPESFLSEYVLFSTPRTHETRPRGHEGLFQKRSSQYITLYTPLFFIHFFPFRLVLWIYMFHMFSFHFSHFLSGVSRKSFAANKPDFPSFHSCTAFNNFICASLYRQFNALFCLQTEIYENRFKL